MYKRWFLFEPDRWNPIIPSQSRTMSNANKTALDILKSSRTGVSMHFSVISGHSLRGGSYFTAEMQSIYSTTPANWISNIKFLNRFSWLIDGTLTGTTTVSQSGPGSNGNVELLHIFPINRNEASQSDVV